MSLTSEQIQTIKATVPVLQVHGKAITTVFYKNMLAAHPDLYSVFNKANQDNGHQQRALADALFAYASYIDNLGVLTPAVELMCHKHASLCIQPDQYQIVGKYLLEAMAIVLGDALTPIIHDAWAAAYWQLANLMIGREAQLYQAANGWTQFRDFRVIRKIPDSAEITSFHLAPVDNQPLPVFRPGQFISVQVDVPELNHPQARQYSLSDQPLSDHYRISVKREVGQENGHAGYVSNILHDQVQEGDVVKVSHPYGDFFLDVDAASSRPIVLLAAGVGLTPLTSMLNTISSQSGTKSASRRIHFVHGARTTDVRAFRAEIQSLVEKLPNLHATFFTSYPAEGDKPGVDYDHEGRVDLGKMDGVKDLFLDDAMTEYYICGPTGFMVSMKEGLLKRGVSGDRIKMELFGTGGVN
ncbi:hypothetical protein EYZ11_004440 [Aspergillus tanneri]|uniref:nitric oxide dioxygenase n=1 Tax=Aspergillus tanneri TaxID=1220188 RepID=A0A4S3JMU8_9EURO|nr:uncharacterized protein ATNIH1004_002908 [Aspergillus tanneri]KAA8650227.1 hypothetical protein ATNIH1004_002908 [Aspergillus tanneri]THC96067.1 hypothetical protein EYZ11_004440 [Aspergillus tanneri]